MTEDKARSGDDAVVPDSQSGQGDAASAEAAASRDGRDSSEMTPEELREALERVSAQAETYKDQALRAQAETENVRRRSERSVENAHKFALEKFTADLLPVVDSFERAVQVAREHAEPDSAAPAAIAEGVELSLKLLFDTLEKFGVKAVDPHGEPFDPQYHEAMSMVESPDAEPGSVLHVVQKGYTLNDRLVRAAMVMVAKSPAAGGSGDVDDSV